MEDEVKITFDENYRIRVLEAEKFEHTEQLGEACAAFVSKNQEFGKLVASVVQVVDANAQRIEREKLKVIYLDKHFFLCSSSGKTLPKYRQ